MCLNVPYRWLYTLYLSADANYKCALKDKGLRDIHLAPGWAYMLQEARYLTHLADYVDEPPVSYALSIHSPCLTSVVITDQYM
jgi:hypothetical protein